jgi:2-polyprenyl-3-methyl-5-hydroxy-6-metoxy-1,4-benzoquinol methylase
MRDRLFDAPGEWNMVQCARADCGLLWLDPMPLAEDLGLAYARYYTHDPGPKRVGILSSLFAAAKRGYLANAWGYGHDVTAIHRMLGVLPLVYPGRKTELDFSVMWLGAACRGRLLDVGAGRGILVEGLRALGWKAEGLDFDPAAVQSARERGLTFHLGGLAEQRFPDRAFDAITMSHSLEHVHDPVAWLAEARRILRPGGRLALATPNSRSVLHGWFGAHWFSLDPPRHLHLFNRDALSSALRKAGFARLRVFTSIRDVNGSWRGSRNIRKRGRHDMVAPAGPALNALGRLVQLYVAARAVGDPDAGEELVALAEK